MQQRGPQPITLVGHHEDPSPMKLRECRADDIGAITAIYGPEVTHGRATFELTPPDEAEMQARRAALIAGNYPYLVAEIDGEVAGYAYAGAYRARPAYRATVENSVYVAPHFHRRGIGQGLLEALVGEAASRGFRQMIAVIGDSANVASIRMHERAGFQHTGVLRSVGWKHGLWLDTVLMQRALGQGDEVPSTLAPPP